jgi:CheY-like chemotaxis protein
MKTEQELQVQGEHMQSLESTPRQRAFRRAAGQMGLSVEDRFRFTIILSCIVLSLFGAGCMFYLSDLQAQKFRTEAANIAVTRWHDQAQLEFGRLISPKANSSEEIFPKLLEANRIVPTSLLPEKLRQNDISITEQPDEVMLWVINKHPLIEKNSTLMLSEKEFPELRMAREAFVFQSWLVTTLLMVLISSCWIFFLFGKHYIFRPLNLLRDALLSRRLNAAAKVRQLNRAKVTVERLEEQSRFPLEQFEGDEFGQIAFILEDEDRKQKAMQDSWLKSFNTINEPVAVFGQNARLKHVNESMEQFLDEIGLDPELVRNLPATSFLTSYLQLDEEAAAKLCKVLNQKLPKVQKVACTIELPEGNRHFHYSVSTIVNHGERFAIFTLVRDQVLRNSQSVEEYILEQANNQLKIIHRIQHALRDIDSPRSEGVMHLCDGLVDNIHSLLEMSTASNPSLATHKVEFNVFQFFREIQDSSESAMKISVEMEKSVPTFIVGDPTHLRQCLKGVFQSCQELNSLSLATLNVGYNQTEKKMIISLLTPDGSAVLRDPSLELYLSHYSPFLMLVNTHEDNLHSDEFIRFQIAAQAGINRIESLALDLSNFLLPKNFYIVADDLLPDEAQDIINSVQGANCSWLTTSDALELQPAGDAECMLLFITGTQKLKEKQVQKVINHMRANGVPAILLSQQPRRGESLTALRLGFVTYLTMPFDQDELHKLLILTMNKSVRESIGKLGLITKHTVRDLVPSLGKILLGNISSAQESKALLLTNTLTKMGFKVEEATTVHSFFELLHKGTFEYIACPDGLSTGLKRRIQLGCRGTPCVVFGESPADENLRSEESKTGSSSTSIHWIQITDAGHEDTVRNALKAAQENEKTFSDLSVNADDETPENNENFEIAI